MATGQRSNWKRELYHNVPRPVSHRSCPPKFVITDANHTFLSISSILTCRFILNLRQVDHSRMPSTISLGEDVQFAAQGSRITLPRFIASFGEPLHTPPARSEEGDEVEDIGEVYNSIRG